MKIGSQITIPNFIMLSISLKVLIFKGFRNPARLAYAIFAWTYMPGNPA